MCIVNATLHPHFDGLQMKLYLSWRIKDCELADPTSYWTCYYVKRTTKDNLYNLWHLNFFAFTIYIKEAYYLSGAKTTMKSPKGAMKGIYEHKELADNDGFYFSPRSLFALPTDNSSLMMDSFQFMGESSDQDLLLDVPSNSSFPEAELLLPTSSSSAQASTSSSSIYPHLTRPWLCFVMHYY